MDKSPEQMLVELLHHLVDTQHLHKALDDVGQIDRYVTNCIHLVPGLVEWWNGIKGQEEANQRMLRQIALDKLTRCEAHALGFGCDWDARQAFKEMMA